MIKIRISYDRQQEAERLLQILSPAIKGAKVQKSENGQHKKIYITIGRLGSEWYNPHPQVPCMEQYNSVRYGAFWCIKTFH